MSVVLLQNDEGSILAAFAGPTFGEAANIAAESVHLMLEDMRNELDVEEEDEIEVITHKNGEGGVMSLLTSHGTEYKIFELKAFTTPVSLHNVAAIIEPEDDLEQLSSELGELSEMSSPLLGDEEGPL